MGNNNLSCHTSNESEDHIELTRLIKQDDIQRLMDDFYKLTNIGGALLDLRGNVIASVGWQDICFKFHRSHPDTAQNCIESDRALTRNIKPGSMKIYRCKNNMIDVAMPVMVGETHVGNLFSGQFFFENEPPDIQVFQDQARRYGFDENEYLDALSKVNLWSRETIETAMNFYAHLAEVISSIGYVNLKLESVLEKQKKLIVSVSSSEKRFARAMEVTQDGLWDWDITTDEVYYSPGYAHMLGYKSTEVPKHLKSWLDLIHPEDKNAALKANMDCIENRRDSFSVEFRMQARDGKWLWINGRGKAFGRDEKGRALRMVGTHTNITERKNAEEAQKKMQGQLVQAQKMESVGMLAGGIAHDFNNLLHAISGNIHLLSKDKLEDDPDIKRIKSINKSIERAGQLVSKLLIFSRKAETHRKKLDLNREVKEASAILERTIPRMISIELKLSNDNPLINADAVQVEQVILNLGSNAADAMPDGGRMLIETKKVHVDKDRYLGLAPGDYAALSVSDTGEGMDKETTQKIYEPFFTTKEAGQGTGLGLASVYGVVKAHNGHITCYSEPDQGTIFTTYWPAISGSEAVENVQDMEREPVKGSETILIVDDEEEIREITKEILESWGYDVLSADSGERALKIYEQQAKDIDLVIMDLNMPGMGGSQCLQLLLEQDPLIRILISSGYSANGQAGKALDAGASGFIGKPYQLKELIRKVREILDS
ncbi:MAG: PocR ligand-binding domain-containing protein [Desulfonatronovibrio sp.]